MDKKVIYIGGSPCSGKSKCIVADGLRTEDTMYDIVKMCLRL